MGGLDAMGLATCFGCGGGRTSPPGGIGGDPMGPPGFGDLSPPYSGPPRLWPQPQPPRAAACCEEARNLGEDFGDWGGVICCRGRQIPCQWYDPGDLPCRGSSSGCDLAVRVIRHCILKHETEHIDQRLSCAHCDPSAVCRALWGPGSGDPDHNECDANCRDLLCVTSYLSDCDRLSNPGDAASCRDLLEQFLVDACADVREYCGGTIPTAACRDAFATACGP